MINLEQIDLTANRSDQLKVYTYSLFFWTCCFAAVNQKTHFKNLPKKSVDDIKNRIISILHGQLALWVPLYIILFNNPGFEEPNTQTITLMLLISSSYFTYDLIACIYYGLSDKALVLHHIITVSGQVLGTYTNFGGTSLIWMLVIGEVSNFPMHMRCILRSIGMRYTQVYDVLELTYFALYVIARGLVAPIMFFVSCSTVNTAMLIKVSQFAGLVQSLYFIYQIVLILKKWQKHQKEKREKNIQYYWVSVNPAIKELSFVKGNQKDNVF